MLNVEIKTYHALPCRTERFFINGIDADIEDFGYMADTDRENASDWGCGCMKFIPRDEKISEATRKYSITAGEFYTIQDKLASALYVGCCGWCI